ncbi:MAG: HD domain-containing protein [Bacteroidota bacterium]
MKIIEVENYVLKRFKNEYKPYYTYHNLNHTLDVVKSSENIARLEGISERYIEIIKTAAFLHDIGILIQFKEHEKHSVIAAKEILPQLGYKSEDIDVIIGLIHSTQMPQIANNILQEIICDADLDYLGREDYFDISLQLRKEWSSLFKQDYSDIQWYMSQKAFLTNHVYHTQSSRKLRNETKLQNIIKVQSLINNLI